MKKIVISLFVCLAIGIFWALKPGDPSEEPATGKDLASDPQPAPPESSELSRAGLPADPISLAGEVPVLAPLQEETRMGALTLALDRLKEALLNPDGEHWEEVEAASQFLAALLEENPENVRLALASFEAESDPALLTALAQIIAPHISNQNPELLAAVLDLAQHSEAPEKRAAALAMLSSSVNPSPETMEAILRLSREDESENVRLNAIYLIGHWVTNDPGRSEEWSRELVKTIDASDSSLVRGTAIQTIALQSGIHQPEILAAMDEYMTHDPTPQNRSIAALALGGVEGELRQPAMALLAQAFAGEPDLDTQRNMITQIARVGGEEAIATLARLPVNDRILQQDVLDYVELLHSGEDDFDQIYSRKFALDAERGTIVGASTHRD